MNGAIADESKLVHALLLLTLAPQSAEGALRMLGTLGPREQTAFLHLSGSHHVVIRALRALQPVADAETRLWIDVALEDEQERINHALSYLDAICQALEANDCPVVVIKSLDHLPDLGNDLDLFTTAPERSVVQVFQDEFGALAQPRSWGDRLANKWNFHVPGLPEPVEVHCERIGQTGEQVAVAQRFITRRVQRSIGSYSFAVPAPEEQVIVASLQRMYRHFYFRVCDIVNAAALVEAGTVNFFELRRASRMGGIWQGVATYLRIVRDYVVRYQERELSLPEEVLNAARFGSDKLGVQRGFIRMPIFSECASLFRDEISAAAKRGDVPATLRLSLLPPLASAAAVAYKLTGSDKGVW